MSDQHKHSNKLVNETSPYLLQHAHNPVNWYPWGEEALALAKAENKLILVSIGYSACHWCHVMERESFENVEIAQLMNENFVCIKVDREERPDVDQVYMNAVHLMKGQGGWPLNCFAMPDGRPVFGGTYFPPSQWRQTLKSLHNSYKENPQKFEDYANHLLNGIAQSEVIHVKSDHDLFEEADLHEIYKNTAATFDHKEGGFGGAPKFPLPIGLEFVLAYGQYYKNTEALDFLHLTLDKMAMGGIYDQIGGGFARYSVDNIWLAPHFEKMLYDNGQLISLYARAFKLAPKALYEKTIRQSLQYISREMSQEEGGFYSALDADSEGVEGKFYVWTKLEIDQVLGNSAEVFCAAYDISEQGNWEGHNIPMRIETYEKLAHQFNLEESELQEILTRSIEKLLEVRAERVRPGLDDKILTSWNAIMLQGLIDAYVSLYETSYLIMAERNANFIWDKLSDKKGKLYRTYKNGVAKIDAFLDDYSLLIKAYVSLYQVTFKKEYLDRSQLLLNNCYHEFLHADSQMFFYTEEDNNLVARKMETTDNVIPAANSIMAQNLMDLGLILSDQRYISHAQVMLQNVQSSLKKGQVYYANWDLLLMRFLSPAKEVVMMGEKSQEWIIEIQKSYSFNTVFAGSKKDAYLPLMEGRYQKGTSLIYVCENKSCKLPVSSVEEALALM
ncbi:MULTISPECIES: thioredoxin domain-containing protein [unclassified Lentimicrobium]|uniref:thioredoxin domain-containing protein n=1 Tax=unclassified Lentimicrobium TaxID=2677434 RepID=UPI0015539EFC|nr:MULTISPECIES: thioredoxin domain-containing protein [unclassified Lentimicrobium]NPD46056.1 thioredoxin domain-containing protein [Lentimicrobium sp. S6]NPD84960.1 thioredoxin domain-containing protein [Lentimicrobium sp. L6]